MKKLFNLMTILGIALMGLAVPTTSAFAWSVNGSATPQCDGVHVSANPDHFNGWNESTVGIGTFAYDGNGNASGVVTTTWTKQGYQPIVVHWNWSGHKPSNCNPTSTPTRAPTNTPTPTKTPKPEKVAYHHCDNGFFGNGGCVTHYYYPDNAPEGWILGPCPEIPECNPTATPTNTPLPTNTPTLDPTLTPTNTPRPRCEWNQDLYADEEGCNPPTNTPDPTQTPNPTNTPTYVCKNLGENLTEVPDGYSVNSDGFCFIPTTPTPEPPGGRSCDEYRQLVTDKGHPEYMLQSNCPLKIPLGYGTGPFEGLGIIVMMGPRPTAK